MDVLSQLMSYQNEYASFVQRYQLLIGVILVPLLYLIRNAPLAIYQRLMNWLTIELIIDESDNVSGHAYEVFSQWLTTHRIEALSRRFEVTMSPKDYIYRIGSGMGLQLFLYQRAWFIVHTSREKAQGNAYRTNRIGNHHLRTFKWNRAKLTHLVQEACNDDVHYIPHITLFCYGREFNGGEIPSYMREQKQLIAQSSYDEVDGAFKRFIEQPEYYQDAGIAYKETIMLYGPPGTGKTNLARHMAAKWQMDILSIDSKSVSLNSMLSMRGIAQRRNGTVILIEEIDSNPDFLLKQKESEAVNGTTVIVGGGGDSPSFGATGRDELLNALDGIVPLNKCIVIITTNYKEKLHPNIYRLGRVDHLIHVDYMPPEEVVELLGYEAHDPRATHILNTPSGQTIPAAAIHQLRYANTTADVIAVLAKKDKALDQQERPVNV